MCSEIDFDIVPVMHRARDFVFMFQNAIPISVSISIVKTLGVLTCNYSAHTTLSVGNFVVHSTLECLSAHLVRFVRDLKSCSLLTNFYVSSVWTISRICDHAATLNKEEKRLQPPWWHLEAYHSALSSLFR